MRAVGLNMSANTLRLQPVYILLVHNKLQSAQVHFEYTSQVGCFVTKVHLRIVTHTVCLYPKDGLPALLC